MTQFCLYLQAHLPRRLKKSPDIAAPFDEELEQQLAVRLASRYFLPATRLLTSLLKEREDFRVCLGLSGPLLETARRHCPELVKSWQDLAALGRENGRLEFLAETCQNSLAGLFRDGAKDEFRAQVHMHSAMLEDLLGVVPTSFRNTDLLYNNSLARIAAELGFKAVLCEGRRDFTAGKPSHSLYTDRLKRQIVLPRDGALSTALAALCAHPHAEDAEFTAWASGLNGAFVMVGLDLTDLDGILVEDPIALPFFNRLLNAVRDRGAVLTTPTAVAAATAPGELPEADVGDLATASWELPDGDTRAWLGNRAQQNLFLRYQELEAPLKTCGDGALLETWRRLGSSDHFRFMRSDLPVIPERRENGSHFDDTSQAVAAYATVLTELRCELSGARTTLQIKKKARRPRILLVTPEITELPGGIGNLANFVHAKGGGLADISAALIAEMVKLGLDVHIALPKYERQMMDFAKISRSELDRLVSLFQGSDAIHLVQDSSFAYIKDVYEGKGPNSALHRAEAFQRAVINQVFDVAMPPHGKMIVHCNDWMTGLIPAAAKSRGIPSIFTVHNVHTNKDTLRNLERCGIDVSRFWRDLFLEKHPDFTPNFWDTDAVDFLLSGVKAADFVNTVSPTFLLEMVQGHFPDLVSKALREELTAKYNNGCAFGILNSPKSNVDPRTSVGLKRNFDASTVMEAKRENKIAFQQQLNLAVNPDAPVFFWPHRIFSQKGPQLLADIAMALVHQYWNDGLQIAIVGNGDPEWLQAFGTIAMSSHGRIAYHTFEDNLSELGKAAADFILMPSLYEPCGLPQMECMRYGTLPIVRATGGLKDTVQHLDTVTDTGNGFVFNDFSSDALWWAIAEAMKFYQLPVPQKEKILRRVMREGFTNFNLEKTTLQYVRLYERLLGEKLV